MIEVRTSKDTAARSADPRSRVVAEAKGWLGTPYHHMGRLKGVGCDCLTFLAEVYHAAGVLPAIDIPHYPPDWHLHRSTERYLDGLLQFSRERHPPAPVLVNRRARTGRAGGVSHPACGEREKAGVIPQPGDVALFRFGRCFSHGAIVVDWPVVIHAWHKGGVLMTDGRQPLLAGRTVRFFDPFTSDTAASDKGEAKCLTVGTICL
jgi:cell wall-associated NlpC family hydrolase